MSAALSSGLAGGCEIRFAQQHRLDGAARDARPDSRLDGAAMGEIGLDGISAIELPVKAEVQDLLSHDGADVLTVGVQNPEAHGSGVVVEVGGWRRAWIGDWSHPSSIGRDAAGVGAPAHAGRLVITPRHLGLAAAVLSLVALLVAFQHVVRLSARQGDMRRAAEVALQEAGVRCDVLNTRAARSECRSSLVPVPRDSASLERAVAVIER